MLLFPELCSLLQLINAAEFRLLFARRTKKIYWLWHHIAREIGWSRAQAPLLNLELRHFSKDTIRKKYHEQTVAVWSYALVNTSFTGWVREQDAFRKYSFSKSAIQTIQTRPICNYTVCIPFSSRPVEQAWKPSIVRQIYSWKCN